VLGDLNASVDLAMHHARIFAQRPEARLVRFGIAIMTRWPAGRSHRSASPSSSSRLPIDIAFS